MKSTISKLQNLLTKTERFVLESPIEIFNHKPAPEKWSKKEILGHLIDSAINNLQRFTEIQFAPKPFEMRKYKQDELVKANAYQEADLKELLNLWISLNKQISKVISIQTETTLNYEIKMDENALFDLGSGQSGKANLRFMIEDYVDHMEHHLDAIFKNPA